MSEDKVKLDEVVAEKKITLEVACMLLGVDPKTHWVRVTYELTRDAASWAVCTLQALPR